MNVVLTSVPIVASVPVTVDTAVSTSPAPETPLTVSSIVSTSFCRLVEKIHEIVEAKGGTVERFLAVIGPWEYFAIIEYPDLEAAFRVVGKIAKLEVFETEDVPRRGRQGVLRGARLALAPAHARRNDWEAALVGASLLVRTG